LPLPSISSRIAQELSVREAQVTATIELFDGGATVPFVARYRKEATGGLDDTKLRTLDERLKYLREMEERRAAILKSIDEQGKLTPDVREQIEAADLRRGMRRIAVLDGEGALTAALFLTRKGQLPPREWVAGQLGRTAASGLELLAGRPATPQADRGPIVCVCLGVGANEIGAAGCAGAVSVADIGKATGAGTNCGSCRPAIARLLERRLGEIGEAAA